MDIVKNVVTNCRNMGYAKTVVKNNIAHITTITWKLIKIIKRNKKSNYGCSNTLNMILIQRKCLSMVIIDRPFEETLRYLKIGTFLFLNQEIDI